MVRWLRWHCPTDTGLEIRALAVWGRARYLSITEAPHNTDFHRWMGKKHFVSFKTPRPGTEPWALAWKAAVLITTLGPPPRFARMLHIPSFFSPSLKIKYFAINQFQVWLAIGRNCVAFCQIISLTKNNKISPNVQWCWGKMKKWSQKNFTQKFWVATEKIEKWLLPGSGGTSL